MNPLKTITALFITALLPYLYISIFVEPIGDDYAMASLLAERSYTEAYIHQYFSWNGQFISTWIQLAFGFFIEHKVLYKLTFVSVIMALFGVIYFMLCPLFKKPITWLLTSAILLMYLGSMARISEMIYWYTAMTGYTLGLIANCLLIGSLIRLRQKPAPVWTALALFSLIFSVGSSSMSMALTLLIVGIYALTNSPRWKWLLPLAIVSTIIYIAAPGNAVRSSNFHDNHHFWYSIGMSLLQTIRFTAKTLAYLPIPITLIILWTTIKQPLKSPRHPEPANNQSHVPISPAGVRTPSPPKHIFHTKTFPLASPNRHPEAAHDPAPETNSDPTQDQTSNPTTQSGRQDPILSKISPNRWLKILTEASWEAIKPKIKASKNNRHQSIIPTFSILNKATKELTTSQRVCQCEGSNSPFSIKPKNDVSKKALHSILYILASTIPLFISSFLPYFATNILGQHRTISFGQFFLVTAILLLPFYILHTHPKTFATIKTRLQKIPKPLLYITLIATFALQGNSHLLLIDLYSGRLHNHRDQHLHREHTIRAATTDTLIHFPPIDTTLLFVIDLSPNPNYWINKHQAEVLNTKVKVEIVRE